jgi:hypothetical protein
MWRSGAVFSLAAMMSCAHAQPAPVTELAGAEMRFASHSLASGVRESFLAVLSDDSILFRPGPVSGREVTQSNPSPPIELNWRPVYAFASASADLGYTTGPWRVRSKTNPAAPPRFGQFISLWKKDAGGVWKLFIDLGISHPQPELTDAWLETASPGKPGAGEGAFFKAEDAFSETAKRSDYAAALIGGAPDIRIYREGNAPYLGLASRANLPAQFAGMTHERIKSGVAKAGDLAFVLVRLAPHLDDGALGKPVAHARNR